MHQRVSTRLEQRWSWADAGACADLPDLFYNSDDDPKGLRRRKEESAKRICQRCPVLETCREYAMVNGELYGVWGGLSENERHRLSGRQRTG